MEIYQLRAFATVAELGQLTRAAEKLHLSQPAVTAQIKALEEELQVALFERTTSGMVLTKAGQHLLAQAEKVLAAAQEFRNEAKVLRGEVSGKISLGTVSDPDFIRLGEFLNLKSERYPLVELDLHQHVSGVALEHVRDGTLDASFYFGEMSNHSISGVALREVAYCVAAPAEWKERVQNAAWEEISGLPWILTPAVSTHSQLLRTLFKEQETGPTKVVEADQETVLNSLIASGVGLSLMREDQARAAEAAGEVVIWDKARLVTTLWFIYRTERASDPAMAALLDVINDIWGLATTRPKMRKPRNRAPQTG